MSASPLDSFLSKEKEAPPESYSSHPKVDIYNRFGESLFSFLSYGYEGNVTNKF